MMRNRFFIKGQIIMIYFDNAATSGKKPQSVIKAVERSLVYLSANPGRSGHSLSVRAAEEVYKARSIVADFFDASGPEAVAFTANCTESLNFVIKGYAKPSVTILTSDLEHNAVMRPLNKCSAQYDTFSVSLFDDRETLKSFQEKIEKMPDLVVCTAASNVLGKKLPLTEIGKICKEKGILFTVDAAQAAGVENISMREMNIDYLCIAPHKGLYSPMGLGILIADKPIPDTIIEGGTGTDSISFVQPENMPERFESGTVNLPAISGVTAGIDFVKKIGPKNIELKEMAVLQRIYDSIRNNERVILYTPRPDSERYAPVLSFNIKGMNSLEVAAMLSKYGVAVRAGLHCAPTAHRKIGTEDIGTVRIAPSVFSTFEDADRFVSIINKKITK